RRGDAGRRRLEREGNEIRHRRAPRHPRHHRRDRRAPPRNRLVNSAALDSYRALADYSTSNDFDWGGGMAAKVEGVEIDTRHWIGGKRVDSADRFQSISPIDETLIADVASAGAVEVDQAVDAAHEAFKTWGKTSREERARLLHKIAD